MEIGEVRILTLKALGVYAPGYALGVFSTPLCKIRSRNPKELKALGADNLYYVLQNMLI